MSIMITIMERTGTATTATMTTDRPDATAPAAIHTCDLIIPAYNEIENIDALFDALDCIRGHVRHIIVADNGSTDGTAEAAARRGALVVREPRRGYGAACLAALREIDSRDSDPPDAVAFLDADLSDDPAALVEVITPVEQGHASMCIGSRVRRAEPGALNFVQRFGNGLACRMMQLLTGVKYSDLGPMRAVRWQTLAELQMEDRTWGWTVEMQMKAALLGIDVAEVDVPYRRRHRGRSKISGTLRGVITAGSKIIATILILWWRRRRVRSQAASTPSSPNTLMR